MTNYEKYKEILKELDLGKSQSDITINQSCSYGTITRAKKWALAGFPTKNKKNSSSESSSSENSSSEIKVIKYTCSNCGREFEIYYDGDGYQTGLCIVCFNLKSYGGISSSESSSSSKISFENKFNSRLLSYLAGVLDIEGYWNLTKKQLKNRIVSAVEKI